MPRRQRPDERRAIMARESGGSFEIPAEMRAFAEKSVEQAKQACESFLNAAQNAVNTAGSQVTTAQSGVKEAGELAMRFAQRNIAASFEFAQKLARAKDPQEVIALHAEYAGSQIAVLSDQAKELGRQAAKITERAAH
ncbi:MAG TPA: phasin family protein [Pseudolabrys sp.]|nr:phasin family protein [Pseudolabrys sp.]